jgi:hypothetical protein
MSWISHLSDGRKKQLAQEEVLDARLQYECTAQCPDVLRNYFFNIRRLNRISSIYLYNSSFYSYPSIISAQMDIVDGIQKGLLETNSSQMCDQLKQANQTILTEINKFLN